MGFSRCAEEALVQRGFMRDYEIWTHHGEGGAGSSLTSKTDMVVEPGDDGQNLDLIGGLESFTDDWVTVDEGGVGGVHCNTDEETNNCEIDLDMEELLRHVEPEVNWQCKGVRKF
jgi:hypothetical protein